MTRYRPKTYLSDIHNDISIINATLSTKSHLSPNPTSTSSSTTNPHHSPSPSNTSTNTNTFEIELWKEAIRNKVTELCEDIECLGEISSQEEVEILSMVLGVRNRMVGMGVETDVVEMVSEVVEGLLVGVAL